MTSDHRTIREIVEMLNASDVEMFEHREWDLSNCLCDACMAVEE